MAVPQPLNSGSSCPFLLSDCVRKWKELRDRVEFLAQSVLCNGAAIPLRIQLGALLIPVNPILELTDLLPQ